MAQSHPDQGCAVYSPLPDTTPEHLPADTENVATYHSTRSSPTGAPLQLDHVFTSRRFHETVETRAMNGVDEWGPIDRCRPPIAVGT